MKFKSFPVILLCVLSLFACKDDEKETAVANASITQAGVLSGTIVSTNLPANGTVVCVDENSSTDIGTAKVGSDGKFSCTIKILSESSLVALEENDGMIISEKNVKGTVFFTHFRTTGSEINLFKTSINMENLSDITNSTEIAVSVFMYVNKNVTISGNENNDGENIIIDMKLKKGWNEVVQKSSINLSSGQVESRITTTVPNGMKWYVTDIDDFYGPFSAPRKDRSFIQSNPFKFLFK
jgi:hypothetical protein